MRRCVICGARVRNMNPKVKTCDSTCTRARKNKVTREQQIRIDIQEEAALERERDQFWDQF